MWWLPVLSLIGRSVGSALLSVLVSFFSGKAFKRLIYIPLSRLVKKTKSLDDDKVVESLREDWDLPKEDEK